jgi:ABC-2 type transport system ATP-binding protein
MDPAPVVVRVSGFGKRYGKRIVAEDIGLTLSRGELHGLIGPDGSGKTSLLKAIAGVLTFDGCIEVFGVPLTSEAAAERIKGRIGFMPQGLGLNLYPDLSVQENIDFFAEVRLVPKNLLEETKSRLLAITRLDKFRNRPMKHLSGGMKQKLGLICTLIHEPELLILDEPTTGVDPVSRRDFWDILTTLVRERGMTALVSTAYMDEASRLQRVSLMYQGRMLAQGTPEELQELVPGTEVRLRVEPQMRALHTLRPRFPQTEMFGDSLRVFVPQTDHNAAASQVTGLLRTMDVVKVTTGPPDLEDIVLTLVGKQPDARVLASIPPPQEQERAGLAIEAVALTRDFKSFRAVDRVSFQVSPGELFGLLGANGAGKTTVIKMLTGILPPSGGRGRVAGADMRAMSKEIKSRIGYVSQLFSLYLDLSACHNLQLFAGIYGLDPRTAKERVAWAIEMGGLTGHEHEATGSLPIGLRQRLALGCALLHRPQVLFLDEPTAGVDPAGRWQFWDILFRLAREDGVAILVTTHYMTEAEHCDKIALMHAGRIVASGSPEELKSSLVAEAGELLEISTKYPEETMALLAAAGLVGVSLDGRRVHLLSKASSNDEARIRRVLTRSGLPVLEIAIRPVSLEDVFVHRIRALEQAEGKAA